jgi:hypothetical protein
MLSKPVSIYKSCTMMLIYRIQVKRHCFIKLPTVLERGQKVPQIPSHLTDYTVIICMSSTARNSLRQGGMVAFVHLNPALDSSSLND